MSKQVTDNAGLDSAALVALFLMDGGTISHMPTPRRPKPNWMRQHANSASRSGYYRPQLHA